MKKFQKVREEGKVREGLWMHLDSFFRSESVLTSLKEKIAIPGVSRRTPRLPINGQCP
jgi:hypothetical protein